MYRCNDCGHRMANPFVAGRGSTHWYECDQCGKTEITLLTERPSCPPPSQKPSGGKFLNRCRCVLEDEGVSQEAIERIMKELQRNDVDGPNGQGDFEVMP